ncbi:tRNA uridine-5-carboxymethylaminomethyl(34) synthesis GTPase MnmE [Sphingomonas sp.]|uniref:tRNA uridine-5-carboxymethylaminomethyl(34) synthesis GTPase MnmE n=1 Tax=Sphingomonas sp. TaxID=28214 RepID=UPI001EB819BA|nr:tRNA uridine-5-carboxymethylaminomethyl(34) synthesis GTPase MnmE [Sphingomonas sp.]MBX3593626.1 tRNA uridine-5-carboxymethylaminomethyl(34) synthesis GTPase MnmE [Sphingomonas sp.]
MSDTIFALSSGAPPAAIAVIRISGAGAFPAVERLAGAVPSPRRASLRRLRDAGGELDRAIVLVFPGPETATGEDLAELHLHGGRAVVRAVEVALAAMPGLRRAEPGEFTRRALEAGRIDLTEAEGLADLLAAETEGQRRAAMRTAEGGVRRRIEEWQARALTLSAMVEAILDHSDEEDLAQEAAILSDVRARAASLADEIDAVVNQPPVERLHDGVRVVLAGPPNAGKSTLLNAMSGREAAIVSDIAGTTRDRIEVPVTREGLAYVLTDTAGLHDLPVDQVERIGIDRAREALEMADIVLWLDEARSPSGLAGAVIEIAAKSDLSVPVQGDRLAVSGRTGAGVAALWRHVGEIAAELVPGADALALNRRQRDLASQAGHALGSVALEPDLLLVAEQLRTALRAFDRITGRADTEAMLDALFARFCIGK